MIFDERGIADAVCMARERSAILHRPVLASVGWDDPEPVSSLATYARGRATGLPCILWARPDSDTWIVGIGEAITVASDAPHPFPAIREGIQRVFADASSCGFGQRYLPPFLGGARFDPKAGARGPWRQFPNARFVLPELTLLQQGARTSFIASQMVDATTDPGRMVEHVLALITSCQRNVQAPDHVVPRLLGQTKTVQGAWERRTRHVLRLIREGNASKIVLARKMALRSDAPWDPVHALRRLLDAYPQCAVFAFDVAGATYVGATPESLANVEDGRLGLTCLAGTTGRGIDEPSDLALAEAMLASDKERREHTAVVTAVADGLRGSCASLSWSDVPEVVRLANVQHLSTPFHGTLREGTGIIDIVASMHPTPALGGTPTAAALDAIRNVEGDRGWYGGPVGWVGASGNGEFRAGIRSALLNGENATLYAGAGIVEGSDPDREYQETELKFRPMLDALLCQ